MSEKIRGVEKEDRIRVTEIADKGSEATIEVGDTGTVDGIAVGSGHIPTQIWVKFDKGVYAALLDQDGFEKIENDD